MNADQLLEAQQVFVVEARDLLGEMEHSLLDMDRGQVDTETVNAIFRAVHTIKGSGGIFGLHAVVAFAHVVESVLDLVRDGELAVTSELVTDLLPCHDHLAALVAVVEEGASTVVDPPEGLLDRLQAHLGDAAAAATPADGVPVDAVEAPSPSSTASRRLHLRLAFGPDCLRGGMDPVSLLRYLTTLGDVVSVDTRWDHLPRPDAFDPESCYLRTELVLVTAETAAAVRSVFDFVADESTIEVEELPDEPPTVAPAAPPTDPPTASATAAPSTPPDPGSPRRAEVPAAEGGRASEARTLRVDASRLDTLIDTVGELVIAGAAASLRAAASDEHLRGAVDEVIRLIEGVRDDALRLRMVPIGTTFNRFQRVVRDVSASLDKSVELVVTGGDTEVDKTLAEQISDPLTHLVRNALDHGIETSEVRLAHGKPATASVRMDARHDSGSIVVTISDDGGGIDRDKVLAKAVERGIVDPGATPSDAEVLRLIFEPGFSTAAQVSDLSGRGVGMDVVRRNVSALRGSIDVASEPGAGTTMTIRLPLTLAIIDGFMVGVDEATMVIPLDRVNECVELPPDGRTRDFIALRGEVLPLIRSRTLLSVDTAVPRRRVSLIVGS